MVESIKLSIDFSKSVLSRYFLTAIIGQHPTFCGQFSLDIKAPFPYMRGCMQRGAELHPNRAARADAVEKVHGFLLQAFHMPG